jgi:hypothetical protein
MRNALAAIGRRFGAPGVTLVGDGGSVWRSSPACQCSGAWGALRATLTCLKGRACGGGPHRGSSWPERSRSVIVGELGGGWPGGARGPVDGERLWLLDSEDRRRATLWKCCRVRKGRKSIGGEKLRRRHFSPELRSGVIPALQGSRPSVEAPGSFTASRQRLCAAPVGLGCGGVVWRRWRRGLCKAEQGERRARVQGSRSAWDGEQRRRGVV